MFVCIKYKIPGFRVSLSLCKHGFWKFFSEMRTFRSGKEVLSAEIEISIFTLSNEIKLFHQKWGIGWIEDTDLMCQGNGTDEITVPQESLSCEKIPLNLTFSSFATWLLDFYATRKFSMEKIERSNTQHCESRKQKLFCQVDVCAISTSWFNVQNGNSLRLILEFQTISVILL